MSSDHDITQILLAWDQDPHAALEQLPPKHRAVVVLRMIEGCSTREAAQALGVPEGTVLSRLARGMQQLQGLLAPARGGGTLPVEG